MPPMSKPNSNRPLSPHLQIYRPQLTSTLSIFHRFAGIATAFGLFLIIFWVGAIAFDDSLLAPVKDFFLTPFGLVIIIGWTLALSYHVIAGLRHLAWDLGLGFSLKAVYITGWLSVILTIALTAFIWLPLIKGFIHE